MVLAQKNYAEQNTAMPEEQHRKRHSDNKNKNKNKKLSRAVSGKAVFLGLVLCIFTMGIVFTFQYAKIASAGFAVNQLKNDIAVLETTNQRLHLEILQHQSLERIEYKAINELGMVYANPAEKQQLAVNRGDITTKPYYVDSGKKNDNVILVEQQGEQLNPIIQAISQLIR